MKATVVGSGNMGTALACLLAQNGKQVTCWDHIPEVVDGIRNHHENKKYLPGVKLPANITADMLLNQAVREARLIVVAVPSPFFRHVVKEFSPFAPAEAAIVGVAKGLETGTAKRMSQVYAEATAHNPEHYVALSGPTVANELVWGKPTAAAVAGQHALSLQKAVHFLSTHFFKLEVCDDLAGVEWGGVLKNVYAIGMGFLDGLSPGNINLRAVFLNMALSEMKRAGVPLGAKEKTLEGLAGLGDLVTTGFSPESHNRRLGEQLALGKNFEDAVDYLGGGVPEGVKSAAILNDLLTRQGVEAPILHLVDACIKHPHSVQRFLDEVWKIQPAPDLPHNGR